MSYDKRNWKSGTTPISADNLEAMDDGIYQNSKDIEILSSDMVTAKTAIKANNTSIVELQASTTEEALRKLLLANLKIAGLSLSSDITVTDLQKALDVYPLIIGSDPPTTSTKGNEKQMYFDIENSCFYVCRGLTGNGYLWEKDSVDISDAQIAKALAEYLEQHPIDGVGADGKSAYQVALDNGFEGTEQEWLLSLKGEDGANGLDGKDGETPVVGIDYFTEQDKAEIVQAVIDSLGGNPVTGYVDENNNVIVTGNLSDGTYVIKYELSDGTTIDIGELTLGGSGVDEATNYFNTETALLNYRLDSSGSPSAYDGMVTTDYISVDSTMNGKNFVISGLTPVKSSTYNYYVRIGFYDENQAVISNTLMSYSEGYAGTVTAWDSDITSDNAYIRISIVLKDNAAITSDDVANLVITLE